VGINSLFLLSLWETKVSRSTLSASLVFDTTNNNGRCISRAGNEFFYASLLFISLSVKKVYPLPIGIGKTVTTELQFSVVVGFVLAVVVSALAQWMALLVLFLFLSSFFLNSEYSTHHTVTNMGSKIKHQPIDAMVKMAWIQHDGGQ
jgi:ABC-type antimicrobial peptide transport system permease subunit